MSWTPNPNFGASGGPVPGDGITTVADFAALLALPSPVLGQIVRTADPVIPGGASHVQWVFTSAGWRLHCPQDLFVGMEPTNGIASASRQIIRQWLLPAGLITRLRYARFYAEMYKSGGTDAASQLEFRLGTTGTVSDTVIGSTIALTATNRKFGFDCIGFASTPTEWRRVFSGAAGWGTAIATTQVYPQNVAVENLDAGPQWLSIAVLMAGTTDIPGAAHIVLQGG